MDTYTTTTFTFDTDGGVQQDDTLDVSEIIKPGAAYTLTDNDGEVIGWINAPKTTHVDLDERIFEGSYIDVDDWETIEELDQFEVQLRKALKILDMATPNDEPLYTWSAGSPYSHYRKSIEEELGRVPERRAEIVKDEAENAALEAEREQECNGTFVRLSGTIEHAPYANCPIHS